jgi:exonuclease V gamma subunit
VAWVTLPVRTFLQQKLGLYLGGELAALPAREPLDLGGLDRWQLGTQLLALALRGGDLPDLIRVARGAGQLPLGSVGTLAYEELWPEVQELTRAAARYRGGEPLDPIAIELDVGGVRLTGTLHELWPAAHLHASFSRLGRRFELAHFVRHLVLSCWKAQQDPRASRYPGSSVVVARNADGEGVSVVQFEGITEPERILADLLDVVQAAQCQALPFVHDVSRAYCEALQDDPAGRAQAARLEAQRRFDDERAFPDAYVRLVYRDFAALSQAQDALGFAPLARRVLGPLLQFRRVVNAEERVART